MNDPKIEVELRVIRDLGNRFEDEVLVSLGGVDAMSCAQVYRNHQMLQGNKCYIEMYTNQGWERTGEAFDRHWMNEHEKIVYNINAE